MQGILQQLLGSLRGRYFVAALSLVLLLLVITWIAQQSVHVTGTSTTRNIKERLAVVEHSEHIRDMLWDTEYALTSFVINPSSYHQQVVSEKIDSAIATTESLHRLAWIKDNGFADDAMHLNEDFKLLRDEAMQLMTLRENIEGLFPAMVLLRDVLTPNNKAFNTATTLAIDEITADTLNPTDSEEYQKLAAIRLHWNNMITTFRGYVALLTGTFGKDNPDIVQQANNINILHTQVSILLEELEVLPEDEISFQTRISLQDMNTASERWYEAYQQVKLIYAGEHWRADAPFIRTRIHPIRTRIRNNINMLDKNIELSNRDDVSDLSTVSSSIINTLWVLTSIALLFIIIGYILLSRSILFPVARIASALKREAFLGSDPNLPEVTTNEAQQLVDAFSEMRNQVQTRQNALEHQALHDDLTGLPNRTLLNDRLQQAISSAERDEHSCALFIMDLDRFKEINDTLGHQVGDQVLIQVGERLRNVLRTNDTVARLGGDEFAVLLPTSDERHAATVAEKILRILDQPVITGEHPLFVGISIGIAIYPLHGNDVQILMQYADIAMYNAKRNNGGFALYDSSKDVHSVDRLSLVNELRTAINANQLELYYQPKFDIQNNNIVIGAEALLRWNHEELGPIKPEMIIELAEQTGLIRPLTSWVLDTAIQQYSACQPYNGDISLSVNLSTHNLQDNDLLDEVSTCLNRYNIKSSSLELEITESAMMADPVHAKSLLTKLHDLGIRVSIDDYGTGFSSLSYLKQLPVAELKIDKSFVIDMINDENDAVIVRSTIDLAHNLGLMVVAEGVENKDVLDILTSLGCDIAQGYYFARPMSYTDFNTWLKTQFTNIA